MPTLTCSIVLYKNNTIVLINAIKSILNSPLCTKLYLVDNSPTNALKNIIKNDRVVYIHISNNIGFGAGHNIAIKKSIALGAKYHLVLNPDVYFTRDDIIILMVEYMKMDETVGMMMPQILNEDGSTQNLPKLLPTPLSIILRKIKIPHEPYRKFINKYELREIPKDLIYNAPVLSGCFTLLNLDAIKTIGMYDDKFFMYFEDWDLSRRMHQHYKTIYFPLVSVYHEYESGANKNIRLFKIFLLSAITYFNKWGWFFDSDRKKINKVALSQFQ